MAFQLHEQFVKSKAPDRICEDLIVTTDHFAAVIDGASDATGADFAGQSGGRFAAEVVAAAIGELQHDASSRQFADAVTTALADAVVSAFGALDGATRWPCAVVACASAHRREVWRIGDCKVIIDGAERGRASPVDGAAYNFRAAVNAALLQKGQPLAEVIRTDPGATAMRGLVDHQQHLANVVGPWGFGCINGRQVPEEYLEVFAIPDGSSEVILASDGYPVVMGTLRESEARLAELVRQDPAAIGILRTIGKATKAGADAPDDRAYLRFAVA